MARKLPMGQRELLKGKLMAQAETKLITLKAASVQLGISYRQGKRILAAYRKGSRCGSDTRKYRQGIFRKRLKEAVRLKALEAYRNRYFDFGPTFAAEKLAEIEGITVSAETLRK